MKKLMTSLCVVLLGMGLTACGNNNHQESASSSTKPQVAKSNSRQASSSSQSSSSTSSQSSSDNRVITNTNDAVRLVAHAMATDDDVWTGTPVDGGFKVTRADVDTSAFVHYDGSITWNDGTTQPYSEVAAPETNGRVNDTFTPSNN